jgi:hypothetical protein
MKQFIVKEKAYAGTYRNPYRRGGGGMKWGPWRTISKHATLEEAIAKSVVIVGLAKRSVFYGGERITDGNKILSGLSVTKEIERIQIQGAST